VIVRSVAWNLLGLGAPLLVALACIPPLIHGLGPPRFGLLTLVWAVVSYFGLFDLGLGRAVTQQVSAAFGAGREREGIAIAANATALLGLLGVIAGIVLWTLASWGVGLLREVADPDEAIRASRAMAWAMPFVVLTSGLRGVLESRGAFGAINRIRLVTGAATFLVPLWVLRAGENDLGTIAWSLAALRIAGFAWHAAEVGRLLPGALRPGPLDWPIVRRLLGFGGWLTVTNLVGPLMSYLDRFVIGSVLSVTAVAWYVTPQEMVTKLLIVASALTSVLFPRMAEIHSGGDGEANRRIERRGLLALYLTLFPITLGLAAAAGPVLRLWVGDAFAGESAVAMQVFCAGVLLNSLAMVPYSAIQARGRADQTALLHLVELPLFLVAIVLLAREWGVAGAAVAWCARVATDFAALWWLSRRQLGAAPNSGIGAVAAIAVATALAFSAVGLPDPLWRAVACVLAAAAGLAIAAFRFRAEIPLPGRLRRPAKLFR
jgi:O-antigen/teichoic acid export membrane protein